MTDTARRMAKLMFIVSMLIVLSAGWATALGVGPSRQVISFAADQEIEGELIIINDANEDFRAAVYPQGAFADYIEIKQPLVDVSAGQAMKRVEYKIKFPSKMPKPGQHKLEVVVRQFPPDAEVTEDTMVSANIALISQFIIKVPYPGKFLEPKLFINGAEDMDTPTKFTLSLYNFGTEKIDEAYAKVEVFGPDMAKVVDLETDKVSVNSKEEGRIEAIWNPDVAKGTYKVVVTLFYDGKETTFEKSFSLGTFVIDVSDIKVDKFTLGDVAKFDILLFNSWNTKIEDVYVEMLVEDNIGNKMTEFKTAAIEIPSQHVGELEAYWYTEDVAPGIYKVKLLIHYAGKIVQKEYDFEVGLNSITRLGMVGQAVTGEESSDTNIASQGLIIFLILIVLVLLIGMNAVWFYVLSKKLKGKGGDNQGPEK